LKELVTFFQPSAPFKFLLFSTKNLQVEQGSDFTLRMKTVEVVPENTRFFEMMNLILWNKMPKVEFSFKITKPIQSLLFHRSMNEFYLQIMN
jgi:hypothetical protein